MEWPSETGGIRSPGTASWIVASYHVVSGNQTPVVCRSNKCSQPLLQLLPPMTHFLLLHCLFIVSAHCVYIHCVPRCVYGSWRTASQRRFSSFTAASRDKTQAVKLVDKRLCLLSHLAGPLVTDFADTRMPTMCQHCPEWAPQGTKQIQPLPSWNFQAGRRWQRRKIYSQLWRTPRRTKQGRAPDRSSVAQASNLISSEVDAGAWQCEVCLN